MSQENVEIVRSELASFSWLTDRDEIHSHVLRYFDPDCEYRPVEEIDALRGHEAVIEWIERWLEAWSSFSVEAEEIVDGGEVVVAAYNTNGLGRGSGVEIGQRLFEVCEMREGRILRMREYLERAEALEAAGLQEQAMSQENVEIVGRVVDAFRAGIERGDFGAAAGTGALAADFEWVPDPGVPGPRPTRGVEGFVAFMRAWTEDFERWSFGVGELIDAGNGLVLALVHQSAIGKGSGAPVELHFGQVYEVEGGQVVRIRNFTDRAAALEAAGLSE